MAPRLSAVVITRNEGKRLRETVENLDDTLPAGAEIVIVDDGSTDRSTEFLKARSRRRRLLRNPSPTGVAQARNFGAAKSNGDVLVFCDAHITLDRGWWQCLVEVVEDPRNAGCSPAMVAIPGSNRTPGYGLTLPDPNMRAEWRGKKPSGPVHAPILPGACMALRREVWEAAGGYDGGMLSVGCVDNEMCLRLWLLGYRLWVTPETVVGHYFRRRSPYPTPSRNALHNRLRTAFVHFTPRRLDRAVGAIQKFQQFGDALLLVLAGNASERRGELLAERVHRDDWFFEKFGLEW